MLGVPGCGKSLCVKVVSALFAAFSEKKVFSDRHLLSEFKKTRPLAVLSAEKVKSLRAWAENRCVSAD